MRKTYIAAGVLLAGACMHAGSAMAREAKSAVSGAVSGGEILYAGQLVPAGTPVRLMFLTEINSRTAIAGQRFKMRVDEPVYINGKPVIPVGTSAWGEVSSVDEHGAVGKGGKLGMHILYLDLPEGRLPLKGDASQKGGGNGAGVVLAIVGFGLLGLLTQGDSARFKGGELITAYIDNAIAPPDRVDAPVEALGKDVEVEAAGGQADGAGKNETTEAAGSEQQN